VSRIDTKLYKSDRLQFEKATWVWQFKFA